MLLARAIVGGAPWYGEVVADRFHMIASDVFSAHERTGQSLAVEDVALLAPVPPRRLVIVMGGFLPPGTTRPPDMKPRWIPKAPNYVTGDGGMIPFPTCLTGVLQMEAELAVVVGSILRRATPDEARDAIFGWTVFNDVTAPEFGASGDWSTGKSLDGFASFGPWIRSDLSEARVLQGLAITTTVNGTSAQSGNTRFFRFAPSEMLSDISRRITLYPGDVVSLGTPPPPAEAVVGDHVVLEVEEVGRLTNHIVAETDSPPAG